MKNFKEALFLTGIILLAFLAMGWIAGPAIYVGSTNPVMTWRSGTLFCGALVWALFWFCYGICCIVNAGKKREAKDGGS